ncbi:uncharacterized protein LOC113210013, partial [Frankliniella occidentalis]|uniref:Uncharacterized protein LOC113210013 n=1 Tax=Frankliniella occidentalis TaxID=133901 RepID=A0A6J1SW86_FRAOC
QPGAQILPQDPRGRRLLVCTGGLRRLQEIPAEPGSAIAESVAVINCCFPEEIVRYYSPGFPDSLLDLMEETVDVQPLDLDQEHVSRWSPPSDGPRGQGARADGLCGADADYRDQKEKALPSVEGVVVTQPTGPRGPGGARTRSCASLTSCAGRRGARPASRTKAPPAPQSRRSRSRTVSRPRRQEDAQSNTEVAVVEAPVGPGRPPAST